MTKFVSRFIKDESGATAIEYGLIAALMAIAVITALTAFGPKLTTAFGKIAGSLDGASSAAETAGAGAGGGGEG